MQNRRECFIATVTSVLAVAIICLTFIYAATPRLPKWEKKKIEAIYAEKWSPYPIVWYDENGYKEENGVWRYVGTYGECYALLCIGNNTDMIFEPVELPYKLFGLSYPVYYPVEADLILYHTKKAFTYEEIYDFEGVEGTYRLCYLASIKNREEWITDAQLERLTRDIEKIAKDYN